jgi:murein hydrolase activator
MSGSKRKAALALTAICGLTVAGEVHGQISAPASSIEGLDAQIAEVVADVDEATASRDRIGAEIEGLLEQRNATDLRLRARVRSLYRWRRAGALPLAGGFDALLRHQSRIERLERMVGRDLDSQRSLGRRVSALREETSGLAGRIEASQRTLTSLRQRKSLLERAALNPWASLAPAPAQAEPEWQSGFGLRIAGEPVMAAFESARGRLPMPVGGSARVSDAEREGGAGLELAATPGVPVRAVSPGTIAYAAPHPSYGRLVIVDHGQGYYSVYGGLGTIAVGVGASVAADTPLGLVGSGPVFFQLRQGTRPLAAREWLGI